MEAAMAYHRTKDGQAFVKFCNKQAREQENRIFKKGSVSKAQDQKR